MDDYFASLAIKDSDANQHLSKVNEIIVQLEKTDPAFLQMNHEVDVSYFDLKRVPAVHFTPKQKIKKSKP